MKKIGIAGLQRENIRDIIEKYAPGEFALFILRDIDAATRVKNGQLDYYIGACNTGAGAALSMAIAIIGFNRTCTIAKPGIQARAEQITDWVGQGKVAFGLSVEHVDHAIPLLIAALRQEAV
ncbi:DUF2620 domain-containing protein [Shimwellia blattae]|uniref:DUF2620 domain-containing protein n=1 Tax=Shimwellia blattae (strain ATCC 29907 / DSM 4481 / JCM 1650 / NBRC 105725 / CDC 9005-74) TaxID=630626 RepID=I2B9Y9_SHIBC|nr:DUF2620 domain-containing protein [Shimwellia blattae]AFJ47343.1 hypothetical protein EBL_c22520 [Shimwellia blattae DSM 4481 = NBRC 105725]GAB80463.1 hypothetical protein YhfU [Shimwellia blattae DSM 4481 = NBRC 105725]VDY64839.1 Protein of uncharacterised function DUF2620 [Shimwellia blattae]VEC22956.1 Protein of uncharacterised function DUF2620 [Shimwellia blattae]